MCCGDEMAVKQNGSSIHVKIMEQKVALAKQRDSIANEQEKLSVIKDTLAVLLTQKAQQGKK